MDSSYKGYAYLGTNGACVSGGGHPNASGEAYEARYPMTRCILAAALERNYYGLYMDRACGRSRSSASYGYGDYAGRAAKFGPIAKEGCPTPTSRNTGYGCGCIPYAGCFIGF